MTKRNKNNAHLANNNLESKMDAESKFPIVGIGASAGGLEALTHFFENMPADTGMAFVVIQHLDRDLIGMMPELLQRTTQMKVRQSSNGLAIKPNHIYIIPPNKNMAIINRKLFLFEPTKTRGIRLPIDFFFRSLANEEQDKSIGIILSGMGSDGTIGLNAIKEKNGIALVQDPQNAKFDGMPNSAISRTLVDVIASAKTLPSKLIEIQTQNTSHQSNAEIEQNIKTNLLKIIHLIYTQTGHDFTLYKKNTLVRRIERRMSIHQIREISLYVNLLQETPKEVKLLFKDLLIGVTNFFRDPAVWQNLEDQVFPELFKKHANGTVLRAWIPGCSTGEEAYSLAIIFKEALKKQNNRNNFSLQIFATDLNNDSVDIARNGIYPPTITADIPMEQINNYFTPTEKGFRVNTEIQEMIVFTPHNIIKDRPYTKLDLISCRNLLIYMEAELQRKLINLFYYSLNLDAYMVLGSAESENSQNTLFTPINPKLKIFKKNTILQDFE